MDDYDFDEGVVKKTVHLFFILSLLDNKCHLVNALEEVVGYVEHLYPSEVHK